MGGASDEEAVVDTRLRVRGVSPSVSQSVSKSVSQGAACFS